MSVLDLDFYKLTMLQFIWKHYADVPVTFRLHSRKQDLRNVLDSEDLSRRVENYQSKRLANRELMWLRSQGIFEDRFLNDLKWLFDGNLPTPQISEDSVEVSGDWFNTTLWETVILSAVSEQYSRKHIVRPLPTKVMRRLVKIGNARANWADFGTRRRWSQRQHESTIAMMATRGWKYGFVGTSNVDLAIRYGLTPVGTYAHELEMVLRNVHDNEIFTTRDVLEKWGAMYPHALRIALSDTYRTKHFLRHHGEFLLENDWRGIRLDSGHPGYLGGFVKGWLGNNQWDVVFSDGLDADSIVELQREFGRPGSNVNPLFGWGTGFTNPNSNLSLVMKAVESNGKDTYKITDDSSKSIS